MTEFTGKTVIITGAGGFLARALARVFATEGAIIAGTDITDEALDAFVAAVEDVGGKALPLKCDLRDWDAARRAVKQVANTFGQIDVLVNTVTARTNPVWKRIEDCTHEEATLLMEVGPLGMLGMMQAVFPYMKERGGKIINIGSGGGRYPTAELGPYGISKAAVSSLTRVGAVEWGQHDINVNCILPLFRSNITDQTLQASPSKIPSKRPPISRYGDAEKDIGRTALFLASEAAAYITGQSIPVDGGKDMVF